MINQCGIYFLIRKGKIVYIGQSIHVFERIKAQKSLGAVFDDVRVIPCREEDLSKYEKRWIMKFLPVDNYSLKPRKSEYKKKPKANKPYKFKRRMSTFRKLTEKSFVGFGKYKNEKISRLLELGKQPDLASMYFKLSYITFFDSVLDAIGITPEWRIEKPGTDENKYYEFCAAVYPDFVINQKRKYERIQNARSKRTLAFEARLNNSKQILANNNMRRKSF